MLNVVKTLFYRLWVKALLLLGTKIDQTLGLVYIIFIISLFKQTNNFKKITKISN